MLLTVGWWKANPTWQRGSLLTYIEWGGWEAARLPWEKEIGEIPQDAVRGSSALPTGKRVASQPPLTPIMANGAQKHLETESSSIGS
ncbi:hypothetical protein DYE48_07545 [Halobacillus trueperi]|uniref:Uncharacterized protein n=1 Tax=Halobacillus trueperi TaxID=156205 RepID=A0A3E0JAL4_9BACI|nr:hypothetical protein DYE48_07545 [Halobacillus trueperi]